MDHIDAVIGDLPELVARDPHLLRLGRFCSTELLLEIGEQTFHLVIDRGRVVEVARGPLRMRAWAFAIRGDRDTWQRFWEPIPAPGFNDIFAMASHGHVRIEGDVGPLLAHLRYVKAVLALPRGRLGSAGA